MKVFLSWYWNPRDWDFGIELVDEDLTLLDLGPLTVVVDHP